MQICPQPLVGCVGKNRPKRETQKEPFVPHARSYTAQRKVLACILGQAARTTSSQASRCALGRQDSSPSNQLGCCHLGTAATRASWTPSQVPKHQQTPVKATYRWSSAGHALQVMPKLSKTQRKGLAKRELMSLQNFDEGSGCRTKHDLDLLTTMPIHGWGSKKVGDRWKAAHQLGGAHSRTKTLNQWILLYFCSL